MGVIAWIVLETQRATAASDPCGNRGTAYRRPALPRVRQPSRRFLPGNLAPPAARSRRKLMLAADCF